MKRGVLCVIEPIGGQAFEREQLGGLIVTTHERTPYGCWHVLPPATLTFPCRFRDVAGRQGPAGRHEIAVHESWLRPLREDETPSSSTTDTPTHTPALA